MLKSVLENEEARQARHDVGMSKEDRESGLCDARLDGIDSIWFFVS